MLWAGIIGNNELVGPVGCDLCGLWHTVRCFLGRASRTVVQIQTFVTETENEFNAR